MDLLKRELERKKKAVALAKKQTAFSTDTGGRKRSFLKATELRRIQEEQEEEERRKKRKKLHLGDVAEKPENQGETKHSRIDEGEDDKKNKPQESTGTGTQDPSCAKDTKSHRDRLEKLTSSEILLRLRSLGLPVRLFGETETDRLARLEQALEAQQHAIAGQSEMDEFRLGQGHNIRNPFIGRKNETDETIEIPAAAAPLKKETTSSDSQKETTHDAGKVDADIPQGDEDDDPHKRIYRFFKGLLRQWEEELALRPDAVKRTAAGKNETKTLKQCKDYIRPLFKLCKSRRLEPSLMSHIIKIVDYCEAGEFVKAHDAYMDVAIGRAAWPIGVTMVGIHARTGRAKIESSNVAHVMNSELQRKYLTSVKRLMSYYQKKREDVAPSKKVMN